MSQPQDMDTQTQSSASAGPELHPNLTRSHSASSASTSSTVIPAPSSTKQESATSAPPSRTNTGLFNMSLHHRHHPSIWTPHRPHHHSGSDSASPSGSNTASPRHSVFGLFTSRHPSTTPLYSPDAETDRSSLDHSANSEHEPNSPSAPLPRFDVKTHSLHPLQSSEKAKTHAVPKPPAPSPKSRADKTKREAPSHLKLPPHDKDRKVIETSTLLHDFDPISGRKMVNRYEVLDEIGRGVHGKVKLGRDLETGDKVAIKVVERTSKRPRLGHGEAHLLLQDRAAVGASGLLARRITPQEAKIRREIAILKKVSHPHVVRLREVIDDPTSNKVYLILEYVERGEVVWRKRASYDVRDRWKKEEHRLLYASLPGGRQEGRKLRRKARRQRRKEREKKRKLRRGGPNFFSLEFGESDDDQSDSHDSDSTVEYLKPKRPSRRRRDIADSSGGEDRTPSPSVGSSFGSGSESNHRSAPDLYHHANDDHENDPYWPSTSSSSDEDELGLMEYVPVLTLIQVRRVFRDVVCGLHYLHHQGIIHRDIKPANLLWTNVYRVKISDFGVSYLGRGPDDEDSEPEEAYIPRKGARGRVIGRWERERELEKKRRDKDKRARERRENGDKEDERELAKTAGTPAFFAPELCSFDPSREDRPPITGAIDIWSLGVTLFCFVFARTPFMAEGEFELFRVIADEPLVVPKRRVRVQRKHQPASSLPSTPAIESVLEWPEHHQDGSLPPDLPPEPVQKDHGSAFFEDVPEQLIDLLHRLLDKNPITRITLEQIKKHPWVLDGIPDPKRWLEENDPGRVDGGRKIEITSEDFNKAVQPGGPSNMINRMKSGIKKTLGFVGATVRKRGNSSAGLVALNSSDGSSVDIKEKLHDLNTAALQASQQSYPKSPTHQHHHSESGIHSAPSYNTPHNKLRSVSLLPHTQVSPLRRSTSTSADSTLTLREKVRERHISSIVPPPSTPIPHGHSHVSSESASGTGTPTPRELASPISTTNDGYILPLELTGEYAATSGLEMQRDPQEKTSGFDRFFNASRRIVRSVRSRDMSAESQDQRVGRKSHSRRHGSRDRDAATGGSSRESSRTRASSVAYSDFSSASGLGVMEGSDNQDQDNPVASPGRRRSSLRRRSGLFSFARSRDALPSASEDNYDQSRQLGSSSRRSSAQSFLSTSASGISVAGLNNPYTMPAPQPQHQEPLPRGLPSMDPQPGNLAGLRVDTTHSLLGAGPGRSVAYMPSADDNAYYDRQLEAHAAASRRALSDRTNERPYGYRPVSQPFTRYALPSQRAQVLPPARPAPFQESLRPVTSSSATSDSPPHSGQHSPGQFAKGLPPGTLGMSSGATVRQVHHSQQRDDYFDVPKSPPLPTQSPSMSRNSVRRQSMPPMGTPGSHKIPNYLVAESPLEEKAALFTYELGGFAAYPSAAVPSHEAQEAIRAAHSPTQTANQSARLPNLPGAYRPLPQPRRNFSSSEEDALPYDAAIKFGGPGAYTSSLSNSTSYPSMLSITSSASMASGSDDFNMHNTYRGRDHFGSLSSGGDTSATAFTASVGSQPWTLADTQKPQTKQVSYDDGRYDDTPLSATDSTPCIPEEAFPPPLQMSADELLDDGHVAEDEFDYSDDSDDDGIMMSISRNRKQSATGSVHHRRRKTGDSVRSVRSLRRASVKGREGTGSE